MIASRKRTLDTIDTLSHQQRARPVGETPVRRDLLERCYDKVTSLREYVLSQLPQGSRLRRKKVASIGKGDDIDETERCLSRLLDTSLVCYAGQGDDSDDTRWEQWLAFSQKEDESYVSLSEGIAGSIFSQNEIVDFVVWLLFSRDSQVGRRPKHLLCDGFRKTVGPDDQGTSNIPGLFSLFPNSNIQALREPPWPQLLALLGKAGEKIMINLLVDSSIYLAVEAGFSNYHQLTGVPLVELDLPGGNLSLNKGSTCQVRKPADIVFVRSRIFYAKPSLTAKGLVQPGYKHIHVLNRYTDSLKSGDSNLQRQGTIKVMMYIFPRQFGLHNVFTSQVDSTLTSQKFQDYTLREEEIASTFREKSGGAAHQIPKIPKRLRGDVEQLVKRLQVLHDRCSYMELLRHHCPCTFDRPSRSRKPRTKKGLISSRKVGPSQHPSTTSYYKCAPSQKYPESGVSSSRAQPLPKHESLVELATPLPQVSSFCQAVMAKIIPNSFWGDNAVQKQNQSIMMRSVDHFIRLRRFETASLHEVTQDLKVASISWLQPPGLGNQNPSRTDTAKRLEIFHEFIYFVFDSLLMPLIRNNFYVTESNTHRYQVFYFRHEVWRQIAEPAMAGLRADMFDEVKLDEALQVLRSRKLGFSQIRLLPKGNKLRPIMNLRRRVMTRGASNKLGRSINTILGPVHSLLKLEKRINPSKLGSTMFSVSDIYTRLKLFKKSLSSNHDKLFLVKVDVKAAFDTIPQEAVVKLMDSVPSQAKYTIMKHAEVKPGEQAVVDGIKSLPKAIRRWHATALSEKENPGFITRIENDLAAKKKNTVFVGSALRSTQNVGELMHLLKEHVEHNIVKVGKKYYRQKVGIPQGSVLSSFLCNYFYADLEEKHLSFLNSADCLLLRLIDDFLLVTLDRDKAIQFVNAMHRGFPEYGVAVNPAKTMANFDMLYDGIPVQKADNEKGFPYCGTTIDCRTLDIAKDRERDANTDVSASLTVDFGRTPGQNFQRKVLNAFKIQSHLMFYDTSHNSIRTVLASLRGAFVETASKMWAYLRCLGQTKQPGNEIILRWYPQLHNMACFADRISQGTIAKVIDVAFLLLTSKSRMMRYPQYTCNVRKSQVAMTACLSFEKVLAGKQSNYRPVLMWLRKEADRLASGQKYELSSASGA
ncbi:telomerase reverse transcriptase [Fusarium austroafricanum]|uniref:Telomerase reverse transcriptase n=1 Tax=Fusarium austroafricanum TaxID=2364996 RepID=A0A8H4KSQ9_9HYPO|nr:telomerase reverse transcriptase [Fusarium austroafricanum]